MFGTVVIIFMHIMFYIINNLYNGFYKILFSYSWNKIQLQPAAR